MVVHGIPGPYRVAEGDLITIDVGVVLDGAIADSAYTYGVGSIDSEAQRLLDVCQDALAAGIAEARLGNRIGDISHAVQTIVEGAGFSVVRSLVGHGVGRYYHEAPHVPNFGRPGRGERLSEGMTIAIEPMITVGSPEVYVHDDGWSISTEDGSLAAHFEHTVAITDAGPDSDPRVGIAVEGQRLRTRSTPGSALHGGSRPPRNHQATSLTTPSSNTLLGAEPPQTHSQPTSSLLLQ